MAADRVRPLSRNSISKSSWNKCGVHLNFVGSTLHGEPLNQRRETAFSFDALDFRLAATSPVLTVASLILATEFGALGTILDYA